MRTMPTKLHSTGSSLSTCPKPYVALTFVADCRADRGPTDTEERPFVCMICAKPFARADILKRHVAGHQDGPENGKRHKRNRNVRTSRACETCVESHLRCDEQKPCTNCRKRNIVCRSSRRNSAPHESRMDVMDGNNLATSQEAFPNIWTTTEDQEMTMSDKAGADIQQSDVFASAATLTDVWGPRGVFDFGLQTNLDFNELDFASLDMYNQSPPPDSSSTSGPGFTSEHDLGPGFGLHVEVAIGTEAFRKSVWRFLPANKDFAMSEQHNLSLPVEKQGNSPESCISVDQRATTDRLSSATRDTIFGMVMRACKPAQKNFLPPSFPSTELLDALLQYFLTAPFSTASSWLHIASLRLSKCKCPELLTAMIASGAAMAPDPALNKLGFALQEVLRISLETLVFYLEDSSRIMY
jgi:hypothetical protein